MLSHRVSRPLPAARTCRRAPLVRRALSVTTVPTNGVPQPGTAPAAVPLPPLPSPPAAPIAIADVTVGADLWTLAASVGATKAAMPLPRVAALGTLAGVCIGFGATLALSVGGALTGAVAPPLQRFIFGAYGFPMGLLAIALLGGELFTGNAFMFTAALVEREVSLRPVLVRSAIAWASNFAVALARGVLCNVAVCIAVLGATASRSLTSKAIGVWFPLSCFASLGFEHVVANMYMFALAAFQGSPAPVAGVAANLTVVTLGNVVGAAVVLGGLMAAAYASPAAEKVAA